MNKPPKIPTADLELSRRALLRYGAAGLAAAALSPLLQACGDSDSVIDPSTGAGEPRMPAEPRSPAVEGDQQILSFRDEVVTVVFSEQVRERFIVHGRLRVIRADSLRGRVVVAFPDGTHGAIHFGADTVIAEYGHVRVDLLPTTLFHVKVNGVIVSLESVARQFEHQNNSTGIGPLSDLSRAFLVPVALGSTPAWREFIGELRRRQNQVNVVLASNLQTRSDDTFTLTAKVFVAAAPVTLPESSCEKARISCVVGFALPLIGVVSCRSLLALCDVFGKPVFTRITITMQAQTAAPPVRLPVDDNTPGFYNAALGTILDGTSGLFPIDIDLGGEDPTINPAPEPDLSPAAAILGDWLSANPLPLNANWTGQQPIPLTWDLSTETAIVYQIDAGPSATRLTGNFAIDNGIFVWVNGQFKFGALAPGGAEEFEYTDIDLGTVPAGINFVQVLREDHGGATGYRVQITAPVP